MAEQRRLDLDALSPWLTAVVALAGTVAVVARTRAHGFWYDEAYTARLAALSLPRAMAGAMQDVHPPGHVLLSWFMARTGLPPEVALRLPSALAYGLVLALVGRRAPLAALALVFHAALTDQAGQARPYALLALGILAVLEAVEARRWLLAGVVAGLTASLQALAPLLVVVTLAIAVPWGRVGRADRARLLVPAALLVAPWLPLWVARATTYASAPWYAPDAGAWWAVTDGLGGLVGLACAAFLARPEGRRVGVVSGLVAALVLPELVGFGVEPQKVGVVVVVACAWAVTQGPRRHLASAALALGFLATSIRVDPRPDLREASQALADLPRDVPVVAVFASETSYYVRQPAPLASYRDPEQVRQRVLDVMNETGATCVAGVHLPGTTSATGLPVAATADVTGLEVVLFGPASCRARIPGGSSSWR